MYDLSQIKPKSQFVYWFVRQGINDLFDMFYQTADSDGNINQINVGSFRSAPILKENVSWNENVNNVDDIDFGLIVEAFEDFKETRPEYIVGIPVPAEIIVAGGDNAAVYEKLITGILLLQHDDNTALQSAQKCLKWLRSTDFYVAPGSVMYHDNYPSGLLQHSLRVVNCAITLMSLSMFKNVSVYGAILACLVHDWCKIGVYEETTRNVKNDETGKWEKQPWYKYRASPWPFGHGVTSMYLAQAHFPLPIEVALAIRFHMSHWYVSKNEEGDLSEANAKFPIVYLLQWADQASVARYIPQ